MTASLEPADPDPPSWPVAPHQNLGCHSFISLILHFLIVAVIALVAFVVPLLFLRILILLLALPLLFSALSNLWRGNKPGTLTLERTALRFTLPYSWTELILYARITEYRELGTCLEIIHTTPDAPALWRLHRNRMDAHHWDRFTAEFKRRLRESGSPARIYDAHTGPPSH